MFEAESHLTILKRLRTYFNSELGNVTASMEGTFAGNILSANAVEFEKAYAEMDLIADAAFPQTSWGDYLSHIAENWGLSRRKATAAVVVLRLTGTANIVVPAGSLFSTQDSINFLTDAVVTLDGQGMANVTATAQITGEQTNVEADTITRIPVSIYGVSAVTNPDAAHDGYNDEDDNTLRSRLLVHLQKPIQSGNVNNYIDWATSVSGVGTAKCLPLWNGNGTVKVIITNADNNVASDELVQRVATYIEKQRPIGATVTVVTCRALTINVSFTVVSGTGDITALKTAFMDYFKNIAFVQGYISYAQLGEVILSTTTGITDYSDLSINEGTNNIILMADQLPTLGTVTV